MDSLAIYRTVALAMGATENIALLILSAYIGFGDIPTNNDQTIGEDKIIA